MTIGLKMSYVQNWNVHLIKQTIVGAVSYFVWTYIFEARLSISRFSCWNVIPSFLLCNQREATTIFTISFAFILRNVNSYERLTRWFPFVSFNSYWETCAANVERRSSLLTRNILIICYFGDGSFRLPVQSLILRTQVPQFDVLLSGNHFFFFFGFHHPS